MTALASGRVAVGYAKGSAVVLDASSGEQLMSLRGITGVHALSPGISLLESSTCFGLADGELQPIGKRIALRSYAVLDAAASAEHVAVAEAGGPLRILDLNGAERASHVVLGGHVLHVAHESTTGTWRAITGADGRRGVEHQLIRLSDEAQVLDQQPLDSVLDATWLRDGATLVYGNQDGLFVLDGSQTTAHPVRPPVAIDRSASPGCPTPSVRADRSAVFGPVGPL